MSQSKAGLRPVLSLVILSAMVTIPAFGQRSRAVERLTHAQAAEDEGTALTVMVDTPTVDCLSDGTGADVNLLYSVVTTGAAGETDLTLVIDGEESEIGTIASGNVEDGGGWTFDGRTKTAEGSVTGFYENGGYTFQICATQDGGGREPKSACSEPVTVTVECLGGGGDGGDEGCPVSEFFGELVSNPKMCNGRGQVKIQIQFRGDFGSFATLDIEGPEGYRLSEVVPRNGNSCTYHHNWNLGKQPSGGVYTIVVNGGELVYGLTLSCNH